jgi:tRNA threonylcarbamoyladenosine biosynthesis protein TsaB
VAIILHIETSGEVCSVCLARDGQILSLEEDRHEYNHAASLAVLIRDCLHKAGLSSLNAVQAIAISSGPGSYTGLRIGTSTAKGICYALDLPLIAVPTLLAMAVDFKNKNPVQDDDILIPCLDARRKEVYYAVYTGALQSLIPPTAALPDEKIFSEYHSARVFGSGAVKVCPPVSPSSSVLFYPEYRPSSTGMVMPALKKFLSQNFENVALFEPSYLKHFIFIPKA